MYTLLCIGLLTSSAFAANDEFGDDRSAEPAGDARVYGTARGTLAVPPGYVGMTTSFSVEVGALFDHAQVGLRLAYLPYPPKVYGDETPENAIGPVVTYAYNVHVSRRVDIFPTFGLGAVFGPNHLTKENMVLPYLQAGLGIRGLIPLDGGSDRGGAVAIGPEIGIVPTILAPYLAVSFSLIGPRPKTVPAS
jgi:hypothetical protein